MKTNCQTPLRVDILLKCHAALYVLSLISNATLSSKIFSSDFGVM